MGKVTKPTMTMTRKILTIFHDAEACGFSSPEQDALSVAEQVLNTLQEHGLPALKLQREWRMYKLDRTVVPQLEECVDIGFSILTVGRKSEAVSSKIRNDVKHFIDSHTCGGELDGVMNRHAVLLAVKDSSSYRNELQALQRVGVQTFVCTKDFNKGSQCVAIRSSEATFVGLWNDIIATTTNSAATSNAATSHESTKISDTDDETDCKSWTFLRALEQLVGPNDDPIGTAICEAVTLDRDQESKGDDDNLQQRFAIQPSLWSPSYIGSDVHASKTPTQVSPPVFSTVTGLARPFQVPVGSTFAKGPTTEGPKWSARTRGAAAVISPTVPTYRGQKVERNQRNLISPTEAGQVGQADPYRIVTGTINRISPEVCRLTSVTGTVDLARKDLDFDYCWMKQLTVGKREGSSSVDGVQEVPVCCRIHKSGRVTDIRLIGRVDRVVRRQFGFIAHPLFPGNIYFRTSDLDQCNNVSNVAQGAIVAFRVGRKEDRVWAMRVWKVPPSAGVVSFQADTADSISSACRAPRHSFHQSERKATLLMQP